MRFQSHSMRLTCVQLALLALAPCAAAWSSPASERAVRVAHGTYVDFAEARRARSTGVQPVPQQRAMSLTSSGAPVAVVESNATRPVGPILPVWTFDVRSARDGFRHQGAIVGTNPFTRPATTRVATKIIPLVLRTHRIAVGLDPYTLDVPTVAGDVTVDPTKADSSCLQAPNNVPANLFAQSPVFRSANFAFGGAYLGNTQYIDAFQRASFYQVLGDRLEDYHVLLSPVNVLDAMVVDVPADEGFAAIDGNVFGPPPFCAPYQIVDAIWLDVYINGTLLPQLARQGVDPTTLPIFMLYNAAEADGVSSLRGCCTLGYHSIAGQPAPTQTYVVAEFESADFFSPAVQDSVPISHEIAEWANDPYIVNEAPSWGHTGQVASCQWSLEVGDPLTHRGVPLVTMPNGFSYQLQELAFFSWFFGGRSIGVNGWYSNNGTFLTDAGPVCAN